MTIPMIVYLDSSDFSDLSIHRGEKYKYIFGELTRLRDLGQVKFVFSAVHVTEMAPISPDASKFSSGRADVISDLCGRNAMISMDRLVDAELKNLVTKGGCSVDIFTPTGEWYPDISGIISPVDLAETIKQELDSATKAEGLNRSDRRALNKRLFRRNVPTQELRQLLASSGTDAGLDTILNSYPMRPGDAKVLHDFIIGKASKARAEKAFLNSLKDVHWVMRWFEQHYDKMTPITEWLRGPAVKFISAMEKVSESIGEMRDIQQRYKGQLPKSVLTSQGWKDMQDQLLVRLVERQLEQKGEKISESIDPYTVDEYCPGISAFVRTLHSAMWTLTQSNPRKPKRSDYGDAVHALYLPYVDIFRADKFMSTFHKPRAKANATIVVPRLVDLLSAISAKA